MARTVLVIHGAGEPRRRQGKVYWEPLVGQDLGRGYVVRAPRMPRPAAPKYWAWARRIDELMAGLREPLLIGHSFGASVLLKYLSETVRRPAIAALFLVATPFWGPDFAEFALPPDFGVRLRESRFSAHYSATSVSGTSRRGSTPAALSRVSMSLPSNPRLPLTGARRGSIKPSPSITGRCLTGMHPTPLLRSLSCMLCRDAVAAWR